MKPKFKRKVYRGFVVICLLQMIRAIAITDETPEYWNKKAEAALDERLKVRVNNNVAKNVILFLGDGMGVTTVTTARIYKGQLEEESGEGSDLILDKFPHVGLIKSYCADKQVSDSAATATAIFCGVKTKFGTLGVNSNVKTKNCSSVRGNEVSSVLHWAQDAGKDTGIVTTTRVTHATPAALYCHSAYRTWESDKETPDHSECLDIARQLVERLPGNRTKVILGGGSGKFFGRPKGQRLDGKDLVEHWKKHHPKSLYVTNTKELEGLDVSKTDYLLGLFSKSHMPYEENRKTGPKGQPSIAEMTKAAILMLKKSPKGFFLMVEGGRIDHGHHANQARKALQETVAMDLAISEALNLTDSKETLILVTADHSHVMTFNGYAERGNAILGVAGTSETDKLPYLTLMYTTGPGHVENLNLARKYLNSSIVTDKKFKQFSLIPMLIETHGGEDVSIYASGPRAHLFGGVQEQNYIAHAIGYAACIGKNKDNCGTDGRTTTAGTAGTTGRTTASTAGTTGRTTASTASTTGRTTPGRTTSTARRTTKYEDRDSKNKSSLLSPMLSVIIFLFLLMELLAV